MLTFLLIFATLVILLGAIKLILFTAVVFQAVVEVMVESYHDMSFIGRCAVMFIALVFISFCLTIGSFFI